MKKNKKTYRVIALALVLMLVFTACDQSVTTDTGTEGSEQTGHTQDITIVMSTDITGFDPWAASSVHNQLVLWQCYDRLFELDEDKKPKAHLAEEANMISDTEWEIKIVQNAKFSDGTDLTSKDVKASIDRGIECGLGGAIFKPLNACDIVDDYTVKITTSSAYPQLPVALCQLIACILPADYIKTAVESGDWSDPICSGRYILESRVPGESIKIVPNKYFWDPATSAQNDSLTYKIVPEASTRTIMVQTGEADLNAEFSTDDYEIAKDDPNVKIYDHKSSVMVHMPMDCNYEPFSNKLVRQAMNYAIDRDNVLLVGSNGFGVTNYTYLSPTCYGWLDNPSGYTYDPEKAKELLKEAGYENGFSFDLYATQAYNAVATQIQSDLAAVGVTANIMAMKSLDEVVARATEGNMHAVIMTWGANPEPTLVLPRLVGENALGAYNLSHYVNPELEALWHGGYDSQDVNDRIPFYEEWQKILCEDCPWVPLYVGQLFCLANKDLQGVQMNTEQIFNMYSLHY